MRLPTLSQERRLNLVVAFGATVSGLVVALPSLASPFPHRGLLAGIDIMAVLAAALMARQLAGGPRRALLTLAGGAALLLAGSLWLSRSLAHGHEARLIWGLAGPVLAAGGWFFCRRAPGRGPSPSGYLVLGVLGAVPVALAAPALPASTAPIGDRLILAAPVLLWTASFVFLALFGPLWRRPAPLAYLLTGITASSWLMALAAGLRALRGLALPGSLAIESSITIGGAEMIAHAALLASLGGVFANLLSRPASGSPAAEALTVSTEHLQRIFLHSRDAIVTLDPALEVTSVSPSIEELSGHQQADWVMGGRSLLDFVHPGERRRVQNFLLGRRAGDSGALLKFRLLCHDGRELWVEMACRLVRSSGGQVREIVLGLRDIDGLMRQEFDLRARVRELEVYHSIASIAASTMNVDRILNAAVDRLQEVTGSEAVLALLREPAAGAWRLAAARGLTSPELAVLRPGEPWLALWPPGEGLQPLFFEDPGLLPAPCSDLPEPRLAALSLVPLQFRGELLGLLVDAFRRPHVFERSERHLLEGVANQVAVAFHNARLLQDLAQRERQAAALNELGRASLVVRDRQAFARELCQRSRDLFAVSHAALYRLDAGRRRLRLEALASSVPGASLPEELDAAEPPLLAALERPRPLAAAAGAAGGHRWLLELRLRSALAIPLTEEGEPKAVLFLGESGAARRFGENDLATASLLGQQVSIIMEKARLVQELERTGRAYERFNRLAVGRELRVKRLKERVAELEERHGGE